VEEKKEVLTEITSIAKEEEKNNVKVDVPSSEELVAKASASFIKHRVLLNQKFKGLSSKAKCRVLDSIMDLPAEGLKVCLQSEDEKLCFAYGQRIQSDKLIIINHHIYNEYQKQKQSAQIDMNKITRAEVPGTNQTADEIRREN
jgi:hypothetical protein